MTLKRALLGLLAFTAGIPLLALLLLFSPINRTAPIPCTNSNQCAEGGCAFTAGCESRFGYCESICSQALTTYCACDGTMKTSSSRCIFEPHYSARTASGNLSCSR